jgi:hypothetical protein
MEINGIPLHPLAVHAAVVLGPAAALAALLYLVPAWRDRLRWPMLVLAVTACAAIWVAYLSGQDFLDSGRFDGLAGELAERIEEHEELAETLRLVVTGFTVVAVVTGLLHRRGGAARIVLSVLLAASAVALAVWTFLVGEAGARAVWGA